MSSDLRQFIREFTQQGFTLIHGGKHPILYRDDVGRISIPGSPSDRRSLHNARSWVRRRIRQSGGRHAKV